MSKATKHDAIRRLCTEARATLRNSTRCYCNDPANAKFGMKCWSHQLEESVQILDDPEFRWEPYTVAEPITAEGKQE